MPIHEQGPVRIHYEEAGAGFPLLLIPGGGLNATIRNFTGGAEHVAPFNPLVEFSGEHRCIAMDQRNAMGGQSTGPVDVERNWDAFTDDQLGLMDHLGIDKFMVMGFCIGGPQIWNLLRRAPDRVAAAVLVQPSGFRPEIRTCSIRAISPAGARRSAKAGRTSRWKRSRPSCTPCTHRAPISSLPWTGHSRATVRRAILIMPDDVPAHPYAVAMEAALLAPNAQASLYPWKESPGKIALALRHAHTFLQANRPAG